MQSPSSRVTAAVCERPGPADPGPNAHLTAKEIAMAPPNTVEARKFFSVEEANRALPLVKAIVGDIVRQYQVVHELQSRLSAVASSEGRRPSRDPYSEELAQSQTELTAEETKLRSYMEELERLGVELKGPDGLCDFPNLRDGREVCLCWRLGEDQVLHWHEVNAGFAGRQPLSPHPAPRAGQRSK